MEQCVTIACTAGTREEASAIARALVEERLAACVQTMPVDSIYRWDGAVQTDAEWLLQIKTRATAIAAVTARIGTLHSYALPEVTVMPIIGGSDTYLEWIAASVAG